MRSCSIISCKATKTEINSLHRFPKNKKFRERWIKRIGVKNIDTSSQCLFICSLHFDRNDINYTLGQIRLKDGVLPLPSSILSDITNRLPVYSANANPQAALAELSVITNQLPAVQPRAALVELSDINNRQRQVDGQPADVANDILHPTLLELRQCHMKIKNLKRKVKNLTNKLNRSKQTIFSLKNLIIDLKKTHLINKEESALLSECAGPKDFLKRQIIKSRGLRLEPKYSEELRKFALTLHFLSPKAYDFIRQTYNTCLPHTRTLRLWYQNVEAEPGFTKESFNALKRQVEQSDHPIVCALILDEMSIRKGLTWDPNANKFHGRVDCGQHIDSDSVEEAGQALVFLVTCINGTWKLPIGYHLINSLNGQQKGVLVNLAIKMCDDVGVKIVS